MSIRLIIVDDHPIVLRGLQVFLSVYPDIEIVAFAINGLEAVEKTNLFNPDVVLMDLNMPEMDGFEATRIIRQILPAIKIITWTGEVIELAGPKALAAGADLCLSKSGDSSKLLQALRG